MSARGHVSGLACGFGAVRTLSAVNLWRGRPQAGWDRWAVLSGWVLLVVLAASGCREELTGPVLEPTPADNACLALVDGEGASSDSEQLLTVFECLNSGHAFDAYESPLRYAQGQGLLDPIFVEGYFDPLGLQVGEAASDLTSRIEMLDRMLNDEEESLDTLLAAYVELQSENHIYAGLELAHAEAAWLSSSFTGEGETLGSPVVDILEAVRSDPAWAAYWAQEALISASMPLGWQAEVRQEVVDVVRQSSQIATPTGLLPWSELARNWLIEPLQDDPTTSLDSPYIQTADQPGRTLFQVMQQPLCQLRSDVQVMAAIQSLPTNLSRVEYLPYIMRTLANYTVDGRELVSSVVDTLDYDQDGYSMVDGDCNDSDGKVYPGAYELTDGKDNNCDLVASDALNRSTDGDNDGVLANQGDCDDTHTDVHPSLTLTNSDGTVTRVSAAEEDASDRRDNDCDGIVDRVPSSLEVAFRAIEGLLPLLRSLKEGSQTNLEYLVDVVVENAGSLEVEEAIQNNESALEATLTNYSNGKITPQLTAWLRVLMPVVAQSADLGLFPQDVLGVLTAMRDDHVNYEAAYLAANTSERSKYDQYAWGCGEDVEQYVDAYAVLNQIALLMDLYKPLENPYLIPLIRFVVNSELLELWVQRAPFAVDADGFSDPAVVDAQLALFDYLVRPPDDNPGKGNDNYPASRMWKLYPAVELLFRDTERLERLDRAVWFLAESLGDPSTALSEVPAAWARLKALGVATWDVDAFLDGLLAGESRYILAYLLSIPADESLFRIWVGDWAELPSELTSYVTDESALQRTGRWVSEGGVGRLLEALGGLVQWVLDKTTLGDTPTEVTPTPTEG